MGSRENEGSGSAAGPRDGVRQRNAGFAAFFLSGICGISCGIVVSLLQERLGFDYSMTGTLLSFMSIGNLLGGFATGILPGRIGLHATAVILSAGYCIGYLIMAGTGWIAVLMLAFFLVGGAKGSVINMCTILVGNNTSNRTKDMNLLQAFYALGALLCPFIIAGAGSIDGRLPMAALGACGFVLWLTYVTCPMDGGGSGRKGGTDWSFLRSKRFWVLTGLIFFQNAAEYSVSGWMVTYFKGSGILSGTLSAYTVTVMWTATLILRMIFASVLPIRDEASAMIKMGLGCTVFYVGMVCARSQTAAIILLFAFAASMAGMNPTAIASAGKMTSVTSMGVMLPAASSGAILMPWVIGIVAEHAGISAGMACNIVPCAGMLVLSVVLKRMHKE